MRPENTDLATYFPHLQEFEHRAIFDGVIHPWEVLRRIGPYIREYAAAARSRLPVRALAGVDLFRRTARMQESVLSVTRLVEVTEDLVVEGTDVVLAAGVILEPGAMIKGGAIIGAETEVRQGAYIRGDVIVGAHCTVGHTTEVKNAIFMNHTEAGHFAYVGDSVLGSYVNLGAGTKCANLQLRRAAEKLHQSFPHIHMTLDGERFDTGTAKFGVIFGDFGEAGCNSVTAPAVLLGAHTWVFANTTVIKGYYPPKSILR
jgi:NDP-sugar pyrophosphorylase family protein